jgi:hypothetical protein
VGSKHQRANKKIKNILKEELMSSGKKRGRGELTYPTLGKENFHSNRVARSFRRRGNVLA